MKIEIKGTGKLLEKLDKLQRMDVVKKIVKVNTAELQGLMQDKAVFKGGYSKGQTRQSILMDIAEDGFKGTVGPGTFYSPYLEYGTRFMNARPFVRPAFDIQQKKFIEDMKAFMK